MNNPLNKERTLLLASLFATVVLSACTAAPDNNNASSAGLSPRASLGKTLFFDTALSASGQQSCGTCHVANRAFAADDGRPVPLGGVNMDLPGLRNAPSLMYASFTPPFHIESDGTPVGGFFRDGRAATLATQAEAPFITHFEMGNADAAEVLTRLRTRPYLQQFTDLFGADVLNNPQTTLERIGQAIAAFETEDPRFHPFDSKYDFWTQGKAQLSAQELNGFRLYNNPQKGNCAACHVDNPSANGTPAMFTDFTYDNLGVPRNTHIAANDDNTTLSYVPYNGDNEHRYYDLGLCGPLRQELAGHVDLCGAFKVPTLRNIALTAPYFHNGQFNTLQDTLGFYVRRDTDPTEWFPTVNGSVVKFDDLPQPFRRNVNTQEVPYNRQLGEAPDLSPTEIKDVVAFLCTLTDGYDPQHPENYTLPAECSAVATPTP